MNDVYWYPGEGDADGVPDILLTARTIVYVEQQTYLFGRRRVVRLVTNDGEVWLSGRARHELLSEVARTGSARSDR